MYRYSSIQQLCSKENLQMVKAHKIKKEDSFSPHTSLLPKLYSSFPPPCLIHVASKKFMVK